MEDYKFKKEYIPEKCLCAVYNYKGNKVFCEILEDKGDTLKLKGQFEKSRVQKKTIKEVQKSKLEFVYLNN